MFELWINRFKIPQIFKRFVVECEFVEKSMFYNWFHMHREPGSVDKQVFFSNSTYHTNYSNIWMSYIKFAQWCVLIWTLILLTLGNNRLLQSINWPKPVHLTNANKLAASVVANLPAYLSYLIQHEQLHYDWHQHFHHQHC